MKLYHGQPTRPIIMSRRLTRKFTRLNNHLAELREKHGTDYAAALNDMGNRRYRDWFVLNRAVGIQSFTDDEAMARGYAGPKGYIIEIDVPQAEAVRHFQGEQLATNTANDSRYIEVYGFSGQEIKTLKQQGHATVTKLRQERHEGQPLPEELRPRLL